MLDLLLVAIYILPVIVAANLADRCPTLSPLLALLTLGLANIGGLWRTFAHAVRRLSFADSPAFDPDKPVHRTAAFLLLLGFLMIIVNHLLPDEADNAAITLEKALPELVGAGALHLGAAFLGVGWALRRSWSEVLGRLCLRVPTLRQAAISIAVGALLWLLTTAAVAVWEGAVPADVFMRQTADARQFSQVFSQSLAAALLLAVAPAVSEEIFYRGALQPVFGIFLSSLFFTATHMQYGLTPAMAILFGVSLGFAWLRLRFHTTAAIIAHALFNFLPYLAGT